MSDVEIITTDDINHGHVKAIVKKMGGLENFKLALRHDHEVSVEVQPDQTTQVIVKSKPIKFFDKNGRGIPDSLTASVCDPNKNFKLSQPEVMVNGAMMAAYQRAESYLSKSVTGQDMIPYADFEAQVKALVEKLKADDSVSNLLKGVWLPIVIPQVVVADYGQTLETVFLPGVENSYKAQYPNRKFTNYRKGQLEGQVTIAPGTRHDQLVTEVTSSSVVGIHFPNPMQGFSVHAQREFVQRLPESFLLSGGFDTATAWIMYPQVLAHSFKTPGYDCAALQYRSADRSLDFRADDDGAEFDCRGNLGSAGGDYSGGLFFRG